MSAGRAWSALRGLILAGAIATVPSCLVQMAAKTDGTPDPALRVEGDTSVALYADDTATEEVLREALLRVPHVQIDAVDADGRARFRASCQVRGCDDSLLETWARDHGDLVTVIARVKTARTGTRICASFRFTPEGGVCLDEYVDDETATVEIRVETKTVHANQAAPPRWRARPTLHARGDGQGQHAVDDAHAAAVADLPLEGLESSSTPQFVLDDGGRLPAAEVVPDHTVFGVFRDGKRKMFVDVASVGTPAETATPLYCCFEPRPGDTLLQQGPQLLLDLVPTAGVTRLTLDSDARAAGLFGISLRARNLRRGLRGGASYEYVVVRDVRLSLGTFELGYGFRPSPSWALGLLAGVGGGQATRTAGDLHATGGHVEALLRATWEPRRWVFVNLDAGFIQSFGYRAWKDEAAAVIAGPLHLGGPLVRLSAEIQ